MLWVRGESRLRLRNAFETSICGTVMTAVCGIALLALIGCGALGSHLAEMLTLSAMAVCSPPCKAGNGSWT